MKVSDKEVAYVAALANLDLTAEEQVRMVKDLNSILGHIDMLNELDTSNVAPMAQVMAGAGSESQQGSERFAYALRADSLIPSLDHKAALQNSPEPHADFFKVPKVIER
jgi:aspartyl-tRNA(Asn)/glutamyl-tRNA(Gln) amidotransferase subunit C